MLSKDTIFEVGQIYFEDDRTDDIVLFREHRIEAIIKDTLVVTRIQPNNTEQLMFYPKNEFCNHMAKTLAEIDNEEWNET